MNFYSLLPEKYPGYLERFTKSEYAGCFAAYYRDVQPLFDELANGCADAACCAADFVEHIVGRIPKVLKRGLISYDICHFLFLYTVPSALQHGSEEALNFANELMNQWNSRFPKYPLKKISFPEINGGFRTKIMGFDIGRD